MSGVFAYKCPCCGGTIEFDSRSQKMKCPYCDTEFQLDTLKQFEAAQMEQDRDPEWQGDHVEQTKEELPNDGTLVSYLCESCGGEIVAEASTAATSCPYCGSPVIVPKQFTGALRPDFVIPFKLDQKAAEQRLRAHVKGRILLPKPFRSENHIREIRGIYVPFWLYDGDVEAELQCRATRVRHWVSGDYEYTRTSHYLVYRGGELGFDRVPADGSENMPDDLMDSIEPFDYEDAVEFQTAYLSGYLADRYSVSAEECAGRANERMRRSTVNAFLGTIAGYTTCVPEHTEIWLRKGRVSYALLPVWILNTKYRDKTYTFAMNGQTGKFVGNLPMDRGKALGIALGVFAAAFLTVFLISGLF